MATDNEFLCSECIGEAFLKSEVEKNGQVEECSYCRKKGKVFAMEKMADAIEAMLKRLFTHRYKQRAFEPDRHL